MNIQSVKHIQKMNEPAVSEHRI